MKSIQGESVSNFVNTDLIKCWQINTLNDRSRPVQVNMANKFFSWFRDHSALEIAIVIAIIIGIFIAAVLIVELKSESYSTLYIYPETYQNYPDNSTISFVYGIHSYEQESTSYNVNFFINSTRIDTKTIRINPGEISEERKIIQLPADLKYPAKVSITSTSPKEVNEVHYWLKTKPPES